jgi:hypothetical protein
MPARNRGADEKFWARGPRRRVLDNGFKEHMRYPRRLFLFG